VSAMITVEHVFQQHRARSVHRIANRKLGRPQVQRPAARAVLQHVAD
jgi:hypothetical protein